MKEGLVTFKTLLSRLRLGIYLGRKLNILKTYLSNHSIIQSLIQYQFQTSLGYEKKMTALFFSPMSLCVKIFSHFITFRIQRLDSISHNVLIHQTDNLINK